MLAECALRHERFVWRFLMTTPVTVATGASGGAMIGNGSVFCFANGKDGFVAVFIMAYRASGISFQNEVFGRILIVLVFICKDLLRKCRDANDDEKNDQ